MKQKLSLLFILLVSGALSPSFTPMIEAATSPGTVVAWGENDYGETTGTAILTSPYSATANPVTLDGQTLSGVTAIAGGGVHSVALKSDGTVVAWGYDAQGQTTGTPTTPTETYGGEATANPVTLNGVVLSGVTAIAAGYYHTVALKSDGTVVAWGDNTEGQTTGTPSHGPYPYSAIANPVMLNGQTLSGVTAIAAGGLHTVALKSDGTVVAWGDNYFGQTTVPAGLTGVTAIAASGLHTVALKSDGTVVAWGRNYNGETAPDSISFSAIANPVILNGQTLSGVTAIAAGWGHTVTLKNDGAVVAWGAGGAGQSGDPHYGQAIVPAGLSSVTAVAAGGYHTLALVVLPQNTLAGSNVTVNMGTVGSAIIALTFPQVTVDGTTTATLIDPSSAGTLPSGYELTGGNLAFQITTTATYVTPPPIIIAFQVPSINAATFSQLRVLHNEDGTLVDRTASNPAPNPTTKTIYASVSSLSPFVVAKSRVPTNKNQCKNGGWQTFVRADGTLFNNQGDCIQYVNTGR